MGRTLCGWQISLVVFLTVLDYSLSAMTRDQLLKSMNMMRGLCAPKFKTLTEDVLNDLRNGVFIEDKELKCYTLCIAQNSGTMTKKNEISLEKTVKQLETMLQPDMRVKAIDAVMQCKDVQKQYKDPCDKTFYSIKCSAEKYPEDFQFP